MRKCINYNLQANQRLNSNNFISVPMSLNYVEAISKWDFGVGYELYNINDDFEVMERFLEGEYYAVISDEQLIGFYCVGIDAKMDIEYQDHAKVIDFGCALNPIWIHHGIGQALLNHAFNYLIQLYDFEIVRITVWSKNHRGIRFFIKYGFKVVDEQYVNYDGKRYKFYLMHYFRSKD